jgi:hypothetical protein
MKEADFAAFLDGFNRLAKLDLDLGESSDPEAAMARLKGYAAHIRLGPEIAGSAAHQIAVLTLVNILSRFALGGVTLSGSFDAPMLAPWPCRTLMGAVEALGGAAGEPAGDCPTAVVGTANDHVDRAVQLTFEGWRGGIVPAGAARLNETMGTAISAVLAAAIGAAEIFAMLRDEPAAGRRPRGVSVWRPDGDQDWLSPASDGPPLSLLPTRLWILGLGHLGQAFLWALAMCPYADRAEVSLVLQDMDNITASTASTSILTTRTSRGRKTRDVARTLEAIGFSTVIVERPFDDQFKRRPEDPSVLICGVDNAHARSQLEAPGFPLIVEAGIGRTAQDFQAVRLHTFPTRRKAADLWKPEVVDLTSTVAETPGYQRLRERGVDECGLARLADTAVGAPFVGTVAGVLMLGQVLRLLHGDQLDAVIDLDLRALDARRAVPNATPLAINPGFQICDA